MKPGVPGSRTEKFRASALKTEGNKDEAERMVDILRSWDTDGDGMFSVQEVLSAARQMAQEKKTSHRLRWVIIGIAIVYIATLLVLLGVTVLAVEISKDQRPDGNSNLISRHTKDVVHTKSKVDTVNPFDFIGDDKDLTDFENVDNLYIDELGVAATESSDGVPEFLERLYKVQMITRNKKHNTYRIDFLGGHWLEVSKEQAILWRPKPEGGCGEGIPEVNGNCPSAVIQNKEESEMEVVDAFEQVDAEDKADSDDRRLQPRSAIVGPAYNTGPRGIGRNINFNSGQLYQNDGIVDLGRARFFSHGQFRSCIGPSCSF